jgi:hypothetical protein
MGVSVTIHRRRAMLHGKTEVGLKSLGQFSSPPARTKKKTSFTFVVDSLTTLTNEHFAWILILFYVASCCEDHLVDQLRSTEHFKINKGCVSHYIALPFTLKSILTWQKKNYGNSNISPCKNVHNLQKIL